jgi:hypothetical protein
MIVFFFDFPTKCESHIRAAIDSIPKALLVSLMLSEVAS